MTTPTEAERKILGVDALEKGIRLACQTFPLDSVVLEVPGNIETTDFKTKFALHYHHEKIASNVRKAYLELPPPSLVDQTADAERLLRQLRQSNISTGEIALQILPILPHILRKSNWQITTTVIGDRVVEVEKGNTTRDNFGVAFDLGTTTVAAYILDLNNGKLIGQAAKTNLQSSFGEDVMSRIDSAQQGQLKDLQEAAVASMNLALDTILAGSPVKRENIYEAVIVGNTCMHHLLLGVPPDFAGVAPFPPVINTLPDLPAATLGLKIAPSGSVHLPPVVSGFIGSDMVVGLVSLDLERKQAPHLMIDIGTNAEIALCANGTIWACSAAAGPAFEGARISCGMRAAPGAIDQVNIVEEALQSRTIENRSARGIAGSGLISAAAALKKQGLLNRRGGVKKKEVPAKMRDENNRGVVIAAASDSETGKPLVLTWRDLGEELVIATAAIRTGIQVLFREAGVGIQDLSSVSLAGAFGNFININDAVEIGLLPDIEPARISGVGNAAGQGAVELLLSVEQRAHAKELEQKIHYIELSAYPDFNRMFSANMKKL